MHSYSNYSAIELSTTDTPIIRIEFASDKETEALFNAAILLNVICDTEEKHKKVKRKETKKVEVLNDEKKSFNPPKFEDKEVIEDLELIETVEVPTRLIVTYVFNDAKIEHHIPKETYMSGEHILNLFYPLTKIKEKTMNNFSVLIRLESGKAMISKDNAIAAISGQSLGSNEEWDGKIKVDETWNRITIGNMTVLKRIKGKYNLTTQEPEKFSVNEKINRFQYLGIKLSN